MGVSVVRYRAADGVACWGVLREDKVHKLGLDYPRHRGVMATYFKRRASFDEAISAESIAVGEVEFLSPIIGEVQLFCQGVNYADHRAEGGLDPEVGEEESLIFMKANSSIANPNATIIRPKGCELLDYEIELGLVMRGDVSAGTTVTDENLQEFVGGLVLCNDVSARDFMFGATAMQWFRGKSCRTFCPMGPVLYLLDEEDFEQLYRLRLVLKMNGEVKQDATTEQLIHKPPKTLTEIAAFADLHSGDVLLTGTPGGVIINLTPRTGLAVMLNLRNDEKRRKKFTAAQQAKFRYLQPGDELELEIKSLDGSIDLGRQHNTIADA